MSLLALGRSESGTIGGDVEAPLEVVMLATSL